MSSKQLVIIPARMGSSRFPGKPLFEIAGMPMIQHCISNAEKAVGRDFTWVATCDEEIFDYIQSIGGNAVMTSHKHERATDRSAEAMVKIEEQLGEKIDIIVMVQGDEPMVTPKMISDSLQPFYDDPKAKVVNLMGQIEYLVQQK